MKRVLTVLLAMLLAFSCLTLIAFAAEEPTDSSAQDTTVATEEVVFDPLHIIFNSSLTGKKNIVTTTNHMAKGTVSKTDEWPGVKIEITETEDPHFGVNYDTYIQKIGAEPQNIENTPFVVLKVLTEEIAFDDFEIYYCAGDVTAPVEECRAISDYAFDAEDGSVYFIFDLTDDATGALHQLRIDISGAEEGALMYLTDIVLLATEQEALDWCGYEETEAPETEAPTAEEATTAKKEEPTEVPTAAPVTKEEGGCGSIITAGFASLALVILGAVCITKKD